MRQLTGWARLGVLGGLTAVLVAYFFIWLPGPSAGLQFMGLELGEWIKFTGVGFERNYFYLPPITLGGMLALLTVGMGNGRFQTWLLRGLALAVSLLAFPAMTAILNEPHTEWLLRLCLIGLVAMLGLLAAAPFWQKVGWLPSLLMMLLGLIGGIAPTRMYFIIQPHVSNIFGQPLGVGAGVWLNALGHLLVCAVLLWQWVGGNLKKASRAENVMFSSSRSAHEA